MEKNIIADKVESKPVPQKVNSFLVFHLAILVILPVLSVFGDSYFENERLDWQLMGKWFIFWAIGIRLFVAGIKQASNPEYTATKIFHLKKGEGLIVIRELGFANISLGVMGILSVINNNWRLIAAVTGGLFFGLAGIQHLFNKSIGRNESIAMFGDLFVLLMVALYLIFSVAS
jgi:hypothetical protein